MPPDRSLILWKLSRSEHNLGLPQKRLLGHNHFVSDIAISTDGHFALSGSWDRSLRLWDLGQGTSTRQFVDHKKDVMSVAFSADNRQIVSGSRDKSLKLWNTLAHCKFTMQRTKFDSRLGAGSCLRDDNVAGRVVISSYIAWTDEGHADWVSCVRFSPNIQNPIIVSCGWDKKVKVSGMNFYASHDSKVMLWDLNEDKHLYTLENKDVINALCFSPNRYWLCAAVGPYIKIWDLEGKLVIDELCPEVVSQYSGRETEPPQCLCMSWSGDGQTLFAGYSDSVIRAWQVITSPSSS
uniref:Small ribosomal subunit protein RACK1 n=1 Tax=Timema shepardi TaxID=629360 RepID=A0A7R9AVA4_TIMSH|nr:unnamed protein product [Timema shepardi]